MLLACPGDLLNHTHISGDRVVLIDGEEPNQVIQLFEFRGGDEGIRTLDPHVANVMLSQKVCIPSQLF